MRKLVLMAICCSGLFYAPLPLNAQNGGGPTPLIPVADMPSDNGAATAPSDAPLEVDADKVPELVPAGEVGGGAQAPSHGSSPTPAYVLREECAGGPHRVWLDVFRSRQLD